MRPAAIALLCGLVAIAAAAALALAWHVAGERAQKPPAPFASVAVPASAPAAASLAAAAPPPRLAAAAAAPRPAAPTSAAQAPRVQAQTTPFGLSSDHRALVQEASIAASDLQRLEQEPRDNDWAPEAERLIRSELAHHDSFAGFDIIAIDCRSTLCAIQAFSYGDEGNRQWVKALDDVYRRSLIDSFDVLNTAFPTQGGRAAVLTFLHRKPASATPGP